MSKYKKDFKRTLLIVGAVAAGFGALFTLLKYYNDKSL